jgi:hypothetical protein
MQPLQDQNPNTSSLSDGVNLSYDTKGNTRVIGVLCKTVEELKQKVHDLETKKIIDETQFPMEILETSGLLPVKERRLKRGSGYRPLLQSEIEEAQKHSVFAAGQARWLGVSRTTFELWAKKYGIYKSSPSRKGMKWIRDPERGKYPLSKILNGELNDNQKVTASMVRYKLANSNVFPLRCNICGYDKKRIVDRKIGILLDHKDGNRRNFQKDNLQWLCLNCMFECGRGYINRGKFMFDSDWKNKFKLLNRSNNFGEDIYTVV